jgi:hypothetical protein
MATTTRTGLLVGIPPLFLTLFILEPRPSAAGEIRLERWASPAAAGLQQDAGGAVHALSSTALGSPVGARSAAAGTLRASDGYWDAAAPPLAQVAALGFIGLLAVAAGALTAARRLRRSAALAALASLLCVAPARALPSWLTHQGRVLVDGQGPTGIAGFKFALLDGQGNVLWTSDGVLPEPSGYVLLPLDGGHYFAYLGRAPMAALDPPALGGRDLKLRIWFAATEADAQAGRFERLEPDLDFGAVPQAFEALAAQDAQTLAGQGPEDFAAAAHQHSGADITSGTLGVERLPALTDALIPDSITIGSLTQVTSRSHADLADIGTNTHAELDAHLGATGNVHGLSYTAEGAGGGLDADTVDGQHASDFAGSAHEHAAEDLTSGTLAPERLPPLTDALVPDTITLSSLTQVQNRSHADLADIGTNTHAQLDAHLAATSNVHGLSYTAEGAGGGLDADTVDGQHASAFAAAAHGHSSLNAADGSPANALVVDNDGNVGVGTSTPQAALHVRGSDPRGHIQDGGSGDTAITRTMAGFELSSATMSTTNRYGPAVKFLSTDPQFTTENPKLLAAIAPRATETYNLDTAGGMALDFFTTPDAPGASSLPLLRMTIDETGNVGIGTPTPAAPFQVVEGDSHVTIDPDATAAGFTNANLVFLRGGSDATAQDAAVWFRNEQSNLDWLFGQDATTDRLHVWQEDKGTPRFTIAPGGNVGIGTADPGAKLDVSGGDIRTSGRLVSTVATGTAPLSVASTTMVASLNADRLDDLHADDIIAAAADEVRTPISALPFTIGQSGAYYLTGDLTFPGSPGFNGITVNASNVTIDLMGFSLIGSGSGLDRGVFIDGQRNIEIRNGTIRGFAAGIWAQSSALVRLYRLRATENSSEGIRLQGGRHMIRDCVIASNGNFGLAVGGPSWIAGNFIHSNQISGIRSLGGGRLTIMDNVIVDNNLADNATNAGISLDDDASVVLRNYLAGNLRANIRVDTNGNSNILEQNVLVGSTDAINFVGSGNFFAGNRATAFIGTAYANTGNDTDGGGNVAF